MSAVSFDLTPIDNSALLTGYTTYDLLASTDTDWTAAVMLFQPATGNIYQHAQGFDGLPTPALIPSQYPQRPEMVYDSYFIGSTAGGGGDLGGSTGYAFDTNRLDVSWFNTTTTDIGTTTIGRLTLTDDTAGTMSVMLTSGEDPALFDVTFSPGFTPVVSQVIQELAAQESAANEWTEPDWWTAPTAYPNTLWDGYWTAPTLYQPTGYRTPRENYSYIDTILRNRDPDFVDARISQFYGGPLNRWIVEPTVEDLPSALPEPGTAVLLGLGGLVLLRHGRAK